MNCSTPGSPKHRQFPEFAQTHVHWVGDAIQPSHPLSSLSPAVNLSQHQGLFQWVSSSHQVAKIGEEGRTYQKQRDETFFKRTSIDARFGWSKKMNYLMILIRAMLRMVYEINRIEELLNFCFDFLFFNKKTSQYTNYRRYKEQKGWNWSPRWERIVRKYFTALQLKSSGSGKKKMALKKIWICHCWTYQYSLKNYKVLGKCQKNRQGNVIQILEKWILKPGVISLMVKSRKVWEQNFFKHFKVVFT